LLSGSCLSPLA